MAGKFTVIPKNTFDALQLDAGVLLNKFDPANPVAPQDEDIICATTGGVNPSCVPTFSDLGADVDNVPADMKELKHLDSWACVISTTGLGTSPELIRMSLGCADIDSETSAIVPRANLEQEDFRDLWWVGDKANGGLVAVQLKNALSTGGFSLQSTKNGKGTIALTITGHVSLENQKEMPMVFYSLDPEEPVIEPDINLDRSNVTIEEDSTVQLTARTTPSGQTVTWSSSATTYATVDENGVVTGEEAGSAVITATMTYDGTTYTDACNVTVIAKSTGV